MAQAMAWLICGTTGREKDRKNVLSAEGQAEEGDGDGGQRIVDGDTPAAGQALAGADGPRLDDVEDSKQDEEGGREDPGAFGEEAFDGG